MGILVDSQDVLRRMLSRVYALQNWGGRTFSESQLLERIHIDVAPEFTDDGKPFTLQELEQLRPFVVVGIDGSNPLTIRRDAMGGGAGAYRPEGSLIFYIEQAAIGETEAEVDREFATLIDGLIMTGNIYQPGILDLTGASDAIDIKQIDCTGVFRINPEEMVSKGDAVRAYFTLRWGA